MGMTEQLEDADPCKCKRLGDFDGKSHHPLCNESAKAPNYKAQRDALLEALKDMRAGWKYIRETHGDLYGVGWDRAQSKADSAIALAQGDV